jgi:Abnormal spindle-like microcephaly-assoc'd, ASPM-SPD-2-Hydin
MHQPISLYFGVAILGASLALAPASGVARPEASLAQAARTAKSSRPIESRAPRIATDAVKLPLVFEVNRGQLDPSVQYRARGAGFDLLLERDGIRFQTAAQESGTERKPPMRRAPGKKPPKLRVRRRKVPDWREQQRLRQRKPPPSGDSILMRFEGATPALAWHGHDVLPGVANYFLGDDPTRWQTRVPLFAGVGAMAMSPGVDCLVYAGERGLEMDFDVARGADLRRMRLDISGAQSLRLSPEGDLLITARTATIRLRNPAIYQMSAGKRVAVTGGYILASNHEVSFRAGAYDANLPLIIDPSVAVTYTTFLGGTGADSANAVALDPSGAVYLSGTTTADASFAEPVTKKLGPLGGANDFFVAKIDPTKTGADSLEALTFIGGSGDEEGGKLALNANGVAIVGTTTSTDYPTTDSTKLVKGTNDLALTLLDTTLSTLSFSTVIDGTGAFSTPLDASGTHGTPAVAFDPSGRVLVTADTTAPDLPVTAGSFQPIWGGTTQTDTPAPPQSDGMLAVYSAPTLTYLTYFGINGFTNDEENFVPATVGVTGIAVDLVGQVYVTGFTSQPGTGFPITNGFQTTYAGGAYDGFLMSFTPKGLGTADLIYSTFLGGAESDEPQAVAVDQAIPANAYVVGTTTSPDELTTPTVSGFQSALHGTANAFLVVVAQTQAEVTSLSYATYLGGSASDTAFSVAPLSETAVYVTGLAGSPNFPTLNTLQSFSGTGDAFLAKLDTTAAGAASLLYATLLGGGNGSQGNGVAALPTGEIVIAGSTTSNDFPLAGNPQTGVQPICVSCQASPALADAFVVAFAESAAAGPVVSFNAPQLNFGNQLVGAPQNPQVGILTNSGTSALTITEITITGANVGDFSQSNDCPLSPSTLAPLATCQLNVNFAPSLPSAESAAISFTDDAVGSPQNINLAGTGQEPLVTISAAAINFGNQPVGTVSNAQTVTITNGGNLALNISALNMNGPDVAQFRFTGSNTCANPPIVQANASCIMNVAFAPQTVGSFNASIALTDNSGNVVTSSQTVLLSGAGTAAAPTANVAPAALVFGSQSVGSSSGPESVGLTNTGSLPLQISSITITGANAGEFKFASGTACPVGGGTLGISAGCTVNISFSPASTGAKTATLSFFDNVAGSPQLVSLSGAAISSAAIKVAPVNVGFPAQTLKVPSAASMVTISNPGTTAVQISSVSVVGPNAADFLQTNNCPGTLNTTATCQVSVQFQPLAGGARTASLSFADSAAGSPQIVTLSGTGLVPAVTLSTATVNFMTQLAGTLSAPSLAKLTNTGNGGLAISTLALSGANAGEFTATHNCGSMLAPAATCNISIVFQPQQGQAGSAAATLSINDNALDSPETVALTGSVDDFSLSASTSGSLSAVVTAGTTAAYSLQVNSLNGFSGSVAIACTGAPADATCSATPSPVSVAATGATPFSVSVPTQLTVSALPGGPMLASIEWIHWPPDSRLGETLSLEIAVLLMALLCAAGFVGPRTWKRMAIASVFVLGLLAAVALTSCGSGGGSGTQAAPQTDTPAGTYTLTVTATFTPAGATQPVARTLPLTLAVQ